MTNRKYNRAVTVNETQALDKYAIEVMGIPSLVLMENAGRQVAQEVLNYLKGKKNAVVHVFCGLGNNAGDGLVVARHLMNHAVKLKVFLIGHESQLKHDAAVNFRILRNIRCPLKEISRLDESIRRETSSACVIVDAIFGVGLNREIAEPYRSIITFLNSLDKFIISVDVPSGLDATKGKIYGVCVKASKTVTFSFSKTGFLKNAGPRCAGQVLVVDVGIPRRLIHKI